MTYHATSAKLRWGHASWDQWMSLQVNWGQLMSLQFNWGQLRSTNVTLGYLMSIEIHGDQLISVEVNDTTNSGDIWHGASQADMARHDPTWNNITVDAQVGRADLAHIPPPQPISDVGLAWTKPAQTMHMYVMSGWLGADSNQPKPTERGVCGGFTWPSRTSNNLTVHRVLIETYLSHLTLTLVQNPLFY